MTNWWLRVAMNILKHPWAAVFFVGFIIYTGIRARYARPTRGLVRTHRQVDALEKALLAIVISSGLLVPLVYLFTPLLGFADYRQPPFVPPIGAAVMVFAIWLFWRSHADLGLNWSATLEIRKDHQLVTRGVYQRIRHPMYASIFLFSAAQAMLLPNWIAGFSAIIPFTLLYFIRTPREELMMCNIFGDEYRAYMQRTGRLLPRLW